MKYGEILIKLLEGLRKLIQHFGSLYINSWIPNFWGIWGTFFWKPGLYCVNFDIFHANKSLYVQEYNGWIKENLDRIGVTDENVRSYFALDVQL